MEGEFVERKAEIQSGMEELRRMMESLQADVVILKKAVLEGCSSYSNAGPKVRVPEPKGFSGNHNAKELGNFMWDMEQFFKAAHVPDAEKISLTSMYLMEDAKLWWRTRVGEDLEAGRPQVAEWETLKREMQDQFLPTNVGWLARESLKGLKHTDSVQEYVKEFSSLMLNIRNMSEEDKLFNFVSGLQRWAQTELRRQGVRDLIASMAAADCLVDLKMVGAINNKQKNKPDGGMKSKADGKGNSMAAVPESGENVQRTSNWVRCFICC